MHFGGDSVFGHEPSTEELILAACWMRPGQLAWLDTLAAIRSLPEKRPA